MHDKITKIVAWLKVVYADRPAVIAVSGGVDSAVALTLLTQAIGRERVTPVCLPYGSQDMADAKKIIAFNHLTRNKVEINIGEMVDTMASKLGAQEGSVQKGNIMARVRMIVLYDLAKTQGALVCGTENKSEHLLGYYTRYGDSASDAEPIASLYKTDVWAMAKHLGLPEIFYTKAPSAGLWEGQTDEGEMGFSYYDADRVLKGEIEGVDKTIVARVKNMVEANKFKREVPYQMG